MTPSTSDPADNNSSRRGPLTRRRLLRAGAILAGGIAALAIGGTTAYYTTRYPASSAHSGWLAIRGATVLNGADLEPLQEAVVLVQDGRIVEVGAGVEIPEDAEVLDLPGGTILPGLIDMHTHLSYPDIEPGEEFGGSDIPGYIWDVSRYMPEMRRSLLGHGVTTVRSLGDELAWVLELRTAIADGTLEGPRIFCAGPVLTTPDGHPISTHGTEADTDAVRLPGTPQEAEEIVAELLDGDRPVDVIKVIQESGTPDNALPPHDLEVLETIVTSAHERGVPVTAHCGSMTDLTQAVDAGVDGVEHLSMRDPSTPSDEIVEGVGMAWPEGMLEQMAESGLTLDPTLVVELANLATESPEGAEARNRVFERLMEAHEAGVAVVAGSDAAIPGVSFGSSLVEEIEALGAAGLSRQDALRAATVQAASALGSDDIGVIEPGRAADLLVVDGDPLTDLSVLHQVVSVLRDGRVVAGDQEPVEGS